MSAGKNHQFLPGFEVREDVAIWRYLDPEKLLSLLETRSLYFASAKQFADKFEGSISHPHVEHRKKANQHAFGSDFDFIRKTESFATKAFQELTRLVKISCWHQNDFESAAMWELYLRDGKGVVIRSTVERLARSIGEYRIQPQFGAENIWLGAVKYIDFDRDQLKPGMLDRFFFKRKSFCHENEFRAAISLRLAEEHGVQVPEDGVFVPVDLVQLIEEIRIAPQLDQSFAEEIKRVLKKHGLKVETKQSDLDKDPIY